MDDLALACGKAMADMDDLFKKDPLLLLLLLEFSGKLKELLFKKEEEKQEKENVL